MSIHLLLFLVRLWQIRNGAYFLHDCKRGDNMFHNIVSIPKLRIPMSRKADKVEKGRGGGGLTCAKEYHFHSKI